MTATSQLLSVTGVNLIAGAESRAAPARFSAADPRTGRAGTLSFPEATAGEVSAAARAAADAFAVYGSWPSRRISAFLSAIAEQLEALGDALIELADFETGLGAPRLVGERSRTCGQLRAFAALVDEGWHVEAIIDHPDPDAAPPRPDLRRMQIPVGPVAVFGASNFPLAFSVPGGDTASALAAGCPVVAKAHPSHPGTSELCARAILAAARRVGAPSGVFSLVHGKTEAVGQALVNDPEIKAVGFTGSHGAGRALFDIGARRAEPIPVYAEMGSVNPVIVTRAALLARGAQIAEDLVASLTMGTGQFCTNPGVVFAPDDAEGAAFVEQVADRLRGQKPAPMLNERIRRALAEQMAVSAQIPGVEVVVQGEPGTEGFALGPSLLQAPWPAFRDHPELRAEHFGPVGLIVRIPPERLPEAVAALQGGLTATIHAEASEADSLAALRDLLLRKAGRLIWNGFPTGVAVTFAQHHGGPYPATTSPAHTSVGATAVRRFLRPVAYQGMPDSLLPAALREGNPLGIVRLVDGHWVVPET